MEIITPVERLLELGADAEKILVGIGAEWRGKDSDGRKRILQASAALKAFLEGRDYYVISDLEAEDFERLNLEKTHTAVPFDVSFTEEQWNCYKEWLGHTLNKKFLLLELGEGFSNPNVIRWPFEKMAALNQKACLFRVHSRLYQITDELAGKAFGIEENSVDFMIKLGEQGGTYGGDQQ